jgi:hypothetical protein
MILVKDDDEHEVFSFCRDSRNCFLSFLPSYILSLVFILDFSFFFIFISKCALLLFVPAILASLAFVFSLVGNVYCSTIHFPGNHPNDPVLSLGVFYYHTLSLTGNNAVSNSETSCSSYPSSTHFDAKWRTAKAFSIMAPVIGGFCLFFTWLSACFRPSLKRWRLGGYLYVTCGVFGSLTMIFLASNACRDNPGITLLGSGISNYSDSCQLGPGAKLNITSFVLWLVLGTALLVLPPPPPLPTPPMETQTVTYQRTTLPDGTVRVTETNIIRGTLPGDDNNNKQLEEIEAAKE